MIRLWNSTEKTFKGNRWVLSETTKCNVTEVTNGEFAVDLEYPLKDNKDISKYFLRGNIITCPVMDDRPEQQFRIRRPIKSSTGVIVYAQAKLIADLGSNYIRAMTLTGLTRKQAIQAVLNAALEPHTFKVGTLDLSTNTNVIVNIKEGTVLNALIGKENSILSEYGGEFIINNDFFDIVDSRGANRNFRIAYGKNIASIKETIDDTDLATVLIPKSGDYRLPEYVIESPKVGNYEKRYFKEVDMNLNIWDGTNEKGEDQITVEEAYSLMRTTCNNMFLKDKVDQVAFNYEIDLISLRKTEEYKYYNIVEKVYLGDTVTVDHKLLNVDLEGKVNKTVYNVLLDKYNSTEIGFIKQDITDIINATIKNIKFAEQKILLQVSNLDNSLNSKIEITADAIRSEVNDKTNQLSSSIEQTASSLTTSISDTKNNLQSQINQTADSIRLEVNKADAGLNSKIEQTASSLTTSISDTKNNLQSQINQTASQLSSKISAGQVESLIEQNSDSVAIAIKDKTNSNVVFNSYGMSINGGGLTINDGGQVMWFDNGIAFAKVVSAENLIIRNTSEGSEFFNTLANMRRMSIRNLDVWGRLGIAHDDFYIDDGYDLREYIIKIVDQYSADRGWGRA